MDVKMQCKCGCDLFYVQEKGPHKGIYCLKCDKWVAWVNKNTEAELKRKGKIKSKSSFIADATKVVPLVQEGAVVDGETVKSFMNVSKNEQELGLEKKTANDIVKEETDGCEICKNGQLSGTYCGGNMQLLKGSYIIHKPDGTINYQFGAIVKYCPHCGREV